MIAQAQSRAVSALKRLEPDARPQCAAPAHEGADNTVAQGNGFGTLTYNFAYLDEQTKRSLRRAILKAVAVPGHQVPFGSREMPMPYGLL